MTGVLISLPWACIVAGLLFALVQERAAHRGETVDLLNRIQAPEEAVFHAFATGPDVEAAPFEPYLVPDGEPA